MSVEDNLRALLPWDERRDCGNDWNPRFEAFARSHGLRPEDVPAGSNLAFSTWMGEQWAAFSRETGKRQLTANYDGSFDAWLLARYSGFSLNDLEAEVREAAGRG